MGFDCAKEVLQKTVLLLSTGAQADMFMDREIA